MRLLFLLILLILTGNCQVIQVADSITVEFRNRVFWGDIELLNGILVLIDAKEDKKIAYDVTNRNFVPLLDSSRKRCIYIDDDFQYYSMYNKILRRSVNNNKNDTITFKTEERLIYKTHYFNPEFHHYFKPTIYIQEDTLLISISPEEIENEISKEFSDSSRNSLEKKGYPIFARFEIDKDKQAVLKKILYDKDAMCKKTSPVWSKYFLLDTTDNFIFAFSDFNDKIKSNSMNISFNHLSSRVQKSLLYCNYFSIYDVVKIKDKFFAIVSYPLESYDNIYDTDFLDLELNSLKKYLVSFNIEDDKLHVNSEMTLLGRESTTRYLGHHNGKIYFFELLKGLKTMKIYSYDISNI